MRQFAVCLFLVAVLDYSLPAFTRAAVSVSTPGTSVKIDSERNSLRDRLLALMPRPHGDPISPGTKKHWGYIDVSGRFVIQPQFDDAQSMSSVAAAVAPDEPRFVYWSDLLYEFIDRNGRVLSAQKSDHYDELKDGLYPRFSGSFAGYADATGKFVIQPLFQECQPFVNGLALTRYKNHRRIIDVNGKPVWDEISAPVQPSPDGYCVVDLKKAALYFPTDKNLSASGEWFKNNAALTPEPDPQTQKYGYLDRKGCWAIKPKFLSASGFSEGLAAVDAPKDTAPPIDWAKVRSYFIKESGAVAFALPPGANASGFSDGLALVFITKHRTDLLINACDTTVCGLVDKSGRFVVPAVYSDLGRFSKDQPILASLGEGRSRRYGFIDSKNNVVIPFKFKSAREFVDGLAAVLADDDPNSAKQDLTAEELDQRIRQQILDICGKQHIERAKLSLNIDQNKPKTVEVQELVPDPPKKSPLEKALLAMQLPPFPETVLQQQQLSLVIEHGKLYAPGGPEDPNYDSLQRIYELKKQLDMPFEHEDWKVRQHLLEQYSDAYFSCRSSAVEDSPITTLIESYANHGEKDKALKLATRLHARNKSDSWLLAVVAEERGDLPLAEKLLKESMVESAANNAKSSQPELKKTADKSTVLQLVRFYVRQRRYLDAEHLLLPIAAPTYLTKDNGERVSFLDEEVVCSLALVQLMRRDVEKAKKTFQLYTANAEKNQCSASYNLASLFIFTLKESDKAAAERFEERVDNLRSLADGSVAVINKHGAFEMPPTKKFKLLANFDDGKAAVASITGELYGVVNIRGEWLIPPIYRQIGGIGDGLVPVACPFSGFEQQDSLNQWHLRYLSVDTGKVAFETPFDIEPASDSQFHDQLAGVCMGTGYNDCGYIDITGKPIIGPRFNATAPFENGKASPRIAFEPGSNIGNPDDFSYVVKVRRDKPLIVPPNNLADVSRPQNTDEIFPFCQLIDGMHKFGYQTGNGSMVIEPKFDAARPFNESLAAVRIKDKWRYIDCRGEVALPIVYDSAEDFADGLAIVADGKGHFIDKHGTDPFAGKFDVVKPFSEGRAVVSSNGGASFGVIDREGHVIAECKYRVISKYSDGMAVFQLPNSPLWGYLDKDGKEVIAPSFQRAGLFKNGLATVYMVEG